MKLLAAVVLLMLGAGTMAQTATHQVQGYVKKDGTYVAPSMATNPNTSKLDNYSTKGNVNPLTGKEGTVDPYKVEQPKLYQPKKY